MSSVYLVIETKYTATIIRVMINAVIADTATVTSKFPPPFMPNSGPYALDWMLSLHLPPPCGRMWAEKGGEHEWMTL